MTTVFVFSIMFDGAPSISCVLGSRSAADQLAQRTASVSGEEFEIVPYVVDDSSPVSDYLDGFEDA